MEKDIIYNKSCVLMDEIPDKSIRLIVTSPPYFNAKNYDHQDQIGRSSNFYEDYISSMDPVWRECFRVLKPNGKLCNILHRNYCFAQFDPDDRNFLR